MPNWIQKSASLAASLALLLALSGCGGETGTAIEDGSRSALDEENGLQLILDDPEELPDEIPDELPEELPAEADESEASDPGTTAGEEELPYEDGISDDGGVSLDEDGTYSSAEDVSLYLYTFGHLPENYITKSDAQALGWPGGSLEPYAPGCAIGGDRFGNREGLLPAGKYHECDIDTVGASSRGAKRLVYSDDGRIYYTEDHYASFKLLYGEE